LKTPKKNDWIMVEVGKDEFCTDCMEWRKYDHKGKCIVCDKIILTQPKKDKTGSYTEYEREEYELDETEEL
jgi:hypothetical protein